LAIPLRPASLFVLGLIFKFFLSATPTKLELAGKKKLQPTGPSKGDLDARILPGKRSTSGPSEKMIWRRKNLLRSPRFSSMRANTVNQGTGVEGEPPEDDVRLTSRKESLQSLVGFPTPARPPIGLKEPADSGHSNMVRRISA